MENAARKKSPSKKRGIAEIPILACGETGEIGLWRSALKTEVVLEGPNRILRMDIVKSLGWNPDVLKIELKGHRGMFRGKPGLLGLDLFIPKQFDGGGSWFQIFPMLTTRRKPELLLHLKPLEELPRDCWIRLFFGMPAEVCRPQSALDEIQAINLVFNSGKTINGTIRLSNLKFQEMEKPRKPFEVSGLSAIVTGAARGIGAGIARQFVESGADVLLVDLNAAALRKSLGGLKGPGRVETLVLDVSREDAGEKAVGACVNHFGKLNILVNNAGLYPKVPVMRMDPEVFDRVCGVNLRGVVFFSKAAAVQMMRQGRGGRIINISSIHSLYPAGLGMAAYDASKGGVMNFTRNFALEMAPHRILVNCIAPGSISTEGSEQFLRESGMNESQMKEQQEQYIRSRIPLQRLGTPGEVAKAALFLASSAADYVTGTTIVVDGGRLLT